MRPEQLILLQSSGLTAIVDAQGAELQSLRTAEGTELVWQGDPASWPDHAPLLFPVIGPLAGGVFRHGGERYPMPPHGFARSMRFQVVEQHTDRVLFELADNGETRKAYPFAFSLQAAFRVHAGGLEVNLTVENRDSEPMPADVGFHPGFNWPLEQELSKADYVVVFEQEEPGPIRRGTGDPIMLLPGPRPTPVQGRVLRLTDALFEELPIVWDRLNSRSLVFGSPGGLGVSVVFPDSPSLALWMIPGQPYLAIEPWQGYPSQIDFDGPFLEKPGIAILTPGEQRRWRLGVNVLPSSPPV
jgi:galactose mutarotase-like enzyme